MIKKLRRRFIAVTMASVFIVLLLIIIAVNAVNIYQINDSADGVTRLILDNGGSFRKNPALPQNPQYPDKRPDLKGGKDDFGFKDDIKGDIKFDRFHNKDEMPFATRFFTITLDKDGNVVSYDLESIASVSESDVSRFAKKIAAKNGVGWYGNYRYRVSETDGGYLMIILDATSNKSSVFSVLGITIIVGLGAFVLVFALVAALSKRVIKPISETYEKQRQFITNAGHELKTPLTVISANAEILGMTYGENEWSDGILRQSENMRSLIGKMIEMSKLDEGEQTLTFEEFSLSDAVYDTAMSFKAIAGQKGLSLSVDAGADIVFKGDEAAVRQAVSILTDNAIKYCDKNGEVRVALAKTQKGLGREKIRLTVENSFANAEALETERLFDRFYRADKAHTRNNSFGLGLSIAKSIVELHGGEIFAAARGGRIAFVISFVRGRKNGAI